jgi:hypothetical protein
MKSTVASVSIRCRLLAPFDFTQLSTDIMPQIFVAPVNENIRASEHRVTTLSMMPSG